ncbi:MAG: DivIVA domain-containing protein [Nitriliruptorales bacterium]
MERRVRGLTPDDIVNYPLKQSVRGYSVRQVDDLLDRIADEFERVHHELTDTRQRLAQAEARAEALSEAESTLKRTLVTAQRAAEQIMAEAHESAATVIEQAQQEAERQHRAAVISAREELDKLRRDQRELATRIEALREFESDYRSTLRSFVERHLRALDELQQRVAPSVPEAELAADADGTGPAGAGPGGEKSTVPGGAGPSGQKTTGPEPQPTEEEAAPAENVTESSTMESAPQEGPSSIELAEDPAEEQEIAGPAAADPEGDGRQSASGLASSTSNGLFENEQAGEAPGAGGEPRRRWPTVDLSRGEHLRRQVEAAFSQVLTGLEDDEEEKQKEDLGATDTGARQDADKETVVIIHHEPKRRKPKAAEGDRFDERA